MIGTRPDTNAVKLVIADHWTWEDVGAHSLQLQEKINAYIGYVESGAVPKPKSLVLPNHPSYWVTVYMKHPPPLEALQTLAQFEAFLASLHIGFEWSTQPDDAA